jgi:hypothetical protein
VFCLTGALLTVAGTFTISSGAEASTTTTTTPTLTASTPPPPCPTTVTWQYPSSFNGVAGSGPAGSWCLVSANRGPYGTDNAVTAGTLGTYVVELSATQSRTITIPVPGDGYYAGLISGSMTDIGTYDENPANKSVVSVGSQQVTPTCVPHGSCKLVLPANPNINSCKVQGASCPPAWMIGGVTYYLGTNNSLAYASFGVELLYPGDKVPTTPTALSVAVSATVPTKGVGLNTPVPVTATITARGGAVHGITVADTLSTGVKVSSGTLPSSSFSLASGASRTINLQVQSSVSGTASVQVSAKGTDSSGAPVSDFARARFKVGASALAVTIAFLQNNKLVALTEPPKAPLPNTIRLADTDAGEVAQSVKAQVTIKNTTAVPQLNVSVNGTPALSFAKTADANQQVPASITGGPTPKGPLGTLAPGASVTVTYVLTITNNGSFVFTAQVLSSTSASSGTMVSQGTGTITALPTALLFFKINQSSVPNGLVTSGSTVNLTGSVTNRSLTQSLDITPILPDIVGNAGDASPDDDAATPQADGYVPVVAGTLKPGATEDFTAPIITAEDGGTRGTLTYSPEAKVINDDGTETALTPDQIRIAGNGNQVVIHINDSAAAVDSSFSTLADGFTQAFTTCAASWVMSSFNGVKQLLTNFPTVAGQAVVATGSAALSTVQFLAGVEFNVVFWSSLSDSQRHAFEAQVVGDVISSVQKYSDLTGKMDAAIASYFTTLETAYQTGDWHTLGTEAGTVAGSGLPEVASLLLTDATFEAIGRLGAKQATGAISLAQKLRDSEIVQTGVKTLAGLRAGDNLVAKGSTALKTIYGIGAREAAQLQYWAEERGLLISVRSRNPESINWIEKFKAVVKPEILKIKNVDGIDVKFLGYLPADLGSVVFAQPISEAEVLSRIAAAGLSSDQKAAVLARYATREEEWTKWYSTYEGYAKAGKVNIGFDVNAQGVVGPNQAINRRFALEPVSSKSLVGYRPAGTQYFQVELGDGSGGLGTLRRVTGDIDIVAITKADGEILSAGERAQLYIDLQGAVGMQHGETLSWLKNGDILFDTKAKLLADHIPGGELLAVFGPDGSVRAAAINAALTIFNTTTQSVILRLDGAFSAIKPAYERYLAVSLANVGANLNAQNSIPAGG